MPRCHRDDVFDLDLLLPLVRQRLVPNLRNERIGSRWTHKIAFQVDPVFELFEKHSDGGSKNRLGGGFHVVAGFRRPRLRSTLRPGRIAFTDDVPLIDDDEGAAVTRRHDIRVMELNGFNQFLTIDSQLTMISDTPTTVRFGWREIIIFLHWPDFPLRKKTQARDTNACRCQKTSSSK